MRRLEPLHIVLSENKPPQKHARLIQYATLTSDRIQSLKGSERIPSLVTSNGLIAWRFLQAVESHVRSKPTRFCEWGSGVGVVTSLAALQGWIGRGIEIEPKLVKEATKLARDNEVDVTFHQGSYKPDALFEQTWPDDDFDTGHGFGLFDFDVIYMYAWPAESATVTEAVRRFAHPGTIFMRYGGGVTCDAFRVV
ncbi:class I SAM-dependent methyltransferase [Marivita sp.]|jgi:hypothetical protein|uniref:class I SAM-dependent methyltransferase n=1 Tax=Marivita sp. TaxID=2003365 RepID=UPI00321940A9